MNEKQLADSGYGQGNILVNPIHMASIYSAFANNGNMVKPYIEYKTGNTENTLFECKSESDFEKYGLTLSANKKVITWDAKKYVANQNKPVPTTEIKIVYYIKSNV